MDSMLRQNVINHAPTPDRGRHTTKRNVFHLKQKVSPYWLYVPVVPINKVLQNFQSVFTGHQYFYFMLFCIGIVKVGNRAYRKEKSLSKFLTK